MAFADEIMTVIHSMSNVLVMLWDAEHDWQVVNEQYTVFGEQNVRTDILENLRNHVADVERDTYEVFLRKMKAGVKGSSDFVPIKEDRISVSVHIGAKNEIPSYHKLECFLVKDEAGAVVRMIMILHKLDAEEIYRMQLAQCVTNDRTPTMFLRVADEVIKQNPDGKYALIQFDVAKFKAINEMYGENFGDEMLNYFLESLKIICDQDQVYVRLTADVFMIMTTYETSQDLLDFVEKVNANLLGYKGIEYRLVFGIAYVENIRGSLRKYGDRAALARQSIKSSVLTHVKFYEEDMKNTVMTGKYVEDHMEKALKNGEFTMYLQPKYRMPDQKIIGAEALVRWVQPERGIVPPSEFIPVFERNGFITKMDEYIWEQACKTIRSWMDMGYGALPISINVSRVHLRNLRFVDVLNDLTQQYQIPKSSLEIEITETYNEVGITEGITLLKESGFTLLMDDFGSGYSSLNTLKDTQFDVIKIDRGFLQDFIGSERGQKIVEHTIQMTKSIGLDLVAEGVETEEQADFLMGCGCDIAQGFYYAKPMDIDSFNEMLRQAFRGETILSGK